jgi:beta-lactamase regulating signal transducer with metallopeptidase domain
MNAIVSWQLTNLLVAAALVPVVCVATWLLRRRPAVGHVLWFLLLLKLVLPPVGQWPWSVAEVAQKFRPTPHTNLAALEPIDADGRLETPRMEFGSVASGAFVGDVVLPRTEPEPAATTASFGSATQIDAGSSDVDAEPMPWAIDAWTTAALATWGAGSAAAAVILLVRLAQQRRLVRDVAVAPHHLVAAVHRAAAQLGVRAPTVALSRRLRGPVVCCAGRPQLLWPAFMAEREHVAECHGVLAHELAHLARRDHWLLRIELLATICCWWNPLLWFIRRRLHETRELACDALALAAGELERDAYARKLLTLSVGRQQTLVLAPAFGAGTISRRLLQRRLTMVFDDRVRGRVSASGFAAGLLLALIALPGVSWAEPTAEAGASAAGSSSATGTSDESGFGSVGLAGEPGGASGSVSVGDAGTTTGGGYVGTSGAAVSGPVATTASTSSEPPSTGAGTSPYQQNHWQSSSLLPADDLDGEEGREIQFPGGGGKVRISKDENGNLVVVIEQTANVQNGAPNTGSGATFRRGGRGRSGNNSYYSGGGDSYDGDVDNATAEPGASYAFGGGGDSNPLSNAGGSEEMIRLEVELAQVDLEEKRIELERIAKAREIGAVDASELKLAELAVRRAEIKLKQAELQASTKPRVINYR